MPRVTVDWDDQGQSTSQPGQHPGSDTAPAGDGGAPGLAEGSTGTAMSGPGEEDAGGPPAWLIEEIASAASGESAGTTAEDAGAAPS